MQSRGDGQAKRTARTLRRRQQTRDEILEAARTIILRDGVDHFAVSAVADELGLTKPALYYYFKSKEALVFEIYLAEMVGAAEVVGAAVEETKTGADAIEALMRTVFERYRGQLELFLFCCRPIPADEVVIGESELERIRPINDMLYGGAEKRIRADQRAGEFTKKRHARRFAFTAHTSVMGLLTMLAMVASADDPLIHKDDDLINDMCRIYRDAGLVKGT